MKTLNGVILPLSSQITNRKHRLRKDKPEKHSCFELADTRKKNKAVDSTAI
jgi:hypothetical protein